MLLAASPHKDSLRLVVQWIVTSKMRDWLIEQANAKILKKLKDNYGNDYHTFFSSLSTQSESLTKDVMNKIKEIGNESDMRIQLLISKIKNRANNCAVN